MRGVGGSPPVRLERGTTPVVGDIVKLGFISVVGNCIDGYLEGHTQRWWDLAPRVAAVGGYWPVDKAPAELGAVKLIG